VYFILGNRWKLEDEVKKKYTPIIQEFINNLEASSSIDELMEIDLSDTELNPHTLEELLKDLGYEQANRSDNGWQLDFTITMKKDNFKPLSINGIGIIFELNLSEIA